MKFLKRLPWYGVLALALCLSLLAIHACAESLPDWLLAFCARHGFGRFLLELGLNILGIGVFYAILAGIQRMYLECRGQDSPVPKPPPRREAPPPQTIPAAVIGRRAKTRQRPRSRPEVSYHAGFRLADGREVWLAVTGEEYRRLAEGDQGTLAFQGKSCRSFSREGEGQFPEKIKPDFTIRK